jgi:hypothetical protein
MPAPTPAPAPAPLPEKQAVPALEFISSVVTAIELLSKVPKLAAVVKQAGINVGSLFRAKEQAPQARSPLDMVIAQENKRLHNSIEEYYAMDDDSRYDEIEKDKYRRRIAARTCALLKSASPIKEKIPDYDKLVALFCASIPEALAA